MQGLVTNINPARLFEKWRDMGLDRHGSRAAIKKKEFLFYKN